MIAALLAAYLILSGGGGFAAEFFSKDKQEMVGKVVPDQARAAAAVATIKQGREALEDSGKRLQKITKEFSAADEAQSAGVEALTPFMQQVLDERKAAQTASLDRMFELRRSLTAEEWGKLYGAPK